MSQPPKILIRAPNWIGDHVMAIPFYRAMREHYASSLIDLFSIEPLNTLHTGIDFSHVHAISPDDRKSGRLLLSIGKAIRKENYDLVVLLAASFRSALPFFVAGIPARVGFDYGASGVLLTSSIPWKARKGQKHKSHLYLELFDYLTGEPHAIQSAPLKERTPPGKPQVIIAPGASIALREWPYYDDLILGLRAAAPAYEIVVVGGSREKDWKPKISEFNDPMIVDRVGATSLDELTQLCARSSLVIANDSGVAHLAGTLAEAPTLVLFGPGDPHYIQPIGPRVFALRNETLGCSPCESAHCAAPYGYQRCLQDLPADVVLEKALSLIL